MLKNRTKKEKTRVKMTLWSVSTLLFFLAFGDFIFGVDIVDGKEVSKNITVALGFGAPIIGSIIIYLKSGQQSLTTKKKIILWSLITLLFFIGFGDFIFGVDIVDGKEAPKDITAILGIGTPIIGSLIIYLKNKNPKSTITKSLIMDQKPKSIITKSPNIIQKQNNVTDYFVWFNLYQITNPSINSIEQLYDNETKSYNYNNLKMIDRKTKNSEGIIDFEELAIGNYIVVQDDYSKVKNPKFLSITKENNNQTLTSDEEGNITVKQGKNTEKELLYLNGISKKEFDQAFNFYDRPIFKRRLNPTIKEDLFTIESKEFKLLNDLGLVSQEPVYPYMITISTDGFDLRMAKNFSWYEENKNIIIPSINDLDEIQNGFQFEEYVATLLTNLGYDKVEVLPASGDYGTDVLAELNGIKYAIQCKYYSSPVGISAVQEIMGGKNHYNTHLAIVVTNNTFTKSAMNLANSNNIILWDSPILNEMIKLANS